MTVPGRRAKPDPHRVIRGTKLNTYVGDGFSVVMPLNRAKQVSGLPGKKSHVHPKRGPDKNSVFQKVKAHGAIVQCNANHLAERVRRLSLEIDHMPEGWRLDATMDWYVELVCNLSHRQAQRQIELEQARGIVRCAIVRRQKGL